MAAWRRREVDAHREDVLLEVAAGLLDDVDLVDRGGKRRDLLGRQRPGHAELEDACLGQRLADMLVVGTGADDAHLGAAHLDAVEVGGLREGDEVALALVGDETAPLGVGGHHDVLGRIGLEGAWRELVARGARLDERLGMRDAHGLAQHRGNVELLGYLEGALDEVERLLRIARLEHGHAGKRGVVAGVLLVLGRVDGRIVCREQHEPAVDPGVAGGHERVCRDVHADVLHGDERANAAHRRADAHLERDLLVGRPLAVHIAVLGQVLERLGRRRAGIAHAKRDAALPGALRDRLVSG